MSGGASSASSFPESVLEQQGRRVLEEAWLRDAHRQGDLDRLRNHVVAQFLDADDQSEQALMPLVESAPAKQLSLVDAAETVPRTP